MTTAEPPQHPAAPAGVAAPSTEELAALETELAGLEAALADLESADADPGGDS